MRFSSLLALSAATSTLAVVPQQQAQTPLFNDEKFLIELGPGETRWISEDEKWELKRVRVCSLIL
jgi:leucyl aminopeptidase